MKEVFAFTPAEVNSPIFRKLQAVLEGQKLSLLLKCGKVRDYESLERDAIQTAILRGRIQEIESLLGAMSSKDIAS